MNRAVLGVLAAAALCAGTARPEEPDLMWRTDLEAARAEARKAGKPLLVVFRCER